MYRAYYRHTHNVGLVHTMSFRKRIERNARKMKMQIRRDVPGDGNCFFYCVEDQLDRLGLPAPSTGQLRSDLVVFLQTLVSPVLVHDPYVIPTFHFLNGRCSHAYCDVVLYLLTSCNIKNRQMP